MHSTTKYAYKVRAHHMGHKIQQFSFLNRTSSNAMKVNIRGFMFVVAFIWALALPSCAAQPVLPIYDNVAAYKLFSSPPPMKLESIEEMAQRGAMHLHKLVCLTNTDAYMHVLNGARDAGANLTELSKDPAFLTGNTYWINDYLHVGHVHYDIGLIAVAQVVPLDRIVMQRAACHGTLCHGIGTIESFYKGYFAAVLSAAGNLNIPVYTRFEGKSRNVAPLQFSTDPKTEYYNATAMKDVWSRTMALQKRTYFEQMMRRTDLHFGAVGAVNAESVQKFKKAAYALIPSDPSLTTYFDPDPPFKILFAFRAGKASRQIENMDEFVGRLKTAFAPPTYHLRLLDTSNPHLNWTVQLQAVHESHVVVTNHGAFEGNMIYMRNSSLLVELFGNYSLPEVHTFQRLAIMFGLYYARVHAESLTDHHQKFFNLSHVDITTVENTMVDYFDRKPYLLNHKPVAE